MRIAVVNWSRRKVGGTEAYLERIIPELLNAGHEVAFWHEADLPVCNDPIALPDGMPVWCVSEIGAQSALAILSDWHPEVIFAHSLKEPDLEAEMLKISPAVFFAHAYYGTCISGSKTFKSPVPTPCDRRFGWQCLAHYYPHRCGGLNPLTMVKEFRRQSKRLELLSVYKAIVTYSTHMQNEYLNHGFSSERVHCLSPYRPEDDHGFDSQQPDDNGSLEPAGFQSELPTCLQLLFLGRMDFLKGGTVLIDALRFVSSRVNRSLHVTFAGEGPDRQIWQHHAARVQKFAPGLKTEFVGWLDGQQRDALWNDCHLLVLPSVWPEPFALVGLEAGLRSVPAVAFAVGGITDWLRDDVNGYLASGDPPTAENLANAVVKCFDDPRRYARLRRGALHVARQFKMDTHVTALLKVLEKVAHEPNQNAV